MHLFIASCLLIVSGIVDASFHDRRAQSFDPLNERAQRSIGFPYPYGYHYNPIEPSINGLDGLSETFDSKINTYKPIYDDVKMSIHDVNSVPRTHSYQPKDSLYDSEDISVQNIPSLLPEDSYDYKYLASPLNKYLTRPLKENDIAINLVAIKKTSVLGYEFPTYKSPYSLNSVLSSKYPNTFLAASQPAEIDPEISKVSSPTVIILQLLPETLEQESTTTTTQNPYSLIFKKLFEEKHNALKNSVEDESNHEITQETPTEDELNHITSKETQTFDESNVLVFEENPTIDEWSFITTEDESNSITTEDESNSITTEESVTEDQSNSLVLEDDSTEDQSNLITTEENVTADQSNSLAFEEDPANDKTNYPTTEDESNSITTEESVTEGFLTIEENKTEDQSKSIIKLDNSNSVENDYSDLILE